MEILKTEGNSITGYTKIEFRSYLVGFESGKLQLNGAKAQKHQPVISDFKIANLLFCSSFFFLYGHKTWLQIVR